ncbi:MULTISPECIES: helix-turn-helix domain-containing protein [unclassified Marinobacter]|uniref:helix-turn-helix domain-containing protein n=1 Tax=unclassified Marinobacter TaxID=83889 RepID=UPI00273C2601|nr:helix-turn-helix domain-containing protein [Marinobacter sp. MDS2]MDP4546529.1 helix-turn-helix domain-containing protein [Marinobacter sp. MDS2]
MSKKFTLTPERFKTLVSVAENGGSRDDAAKALGITRPTLWRACKRELLESWLEQNIPSRQGAGGGPKPGPRPYRRKEKPKPVVAPLVVPSDPKTQWLTKSWRAAA